MSQCTCFRREKSGPQLFEALSCSKKVGGILLIQSRNLVELRLLVQNLREVSLTFGTPFIMKPRKRGSCGVRKSAMP